MIKSYVENHPEITFSELKRIFPDNIQGRFGVFDLAQNAKEVYALKGKKRHHINPEELIKLKDVEIATCTQWNPKNIAKFIKTAKTLKLKIENK